jgi:Arc/MetJ-type ribon-helix-helix transcriptional regulator
MTIHLKPEQERIIREEIQRGHFRSPDEVLDRALAALREKAKTPKAPEPHKNLVQLFAESPLAGSELTFERGRDFGHDVEL